MRRKEYKKILNESFGLLTEYLKKLKKNVDTPLQI